MPEIQFTESHRDSNHCLIFTLKMFGSCLFMHTVPFSIYVETIIHAYIHKEISLIYFCCRVICKPLTSKTKDLNELVNMFLIYNNYYYLTSYNRFLLKEC